MNRTIFRTFTALSLVVAAGAASGCSSKPSDADSSTSAVTTEADGKLGPKAFRQIFGGYLTAEGKSSEDVAKLVFLPSDKLIDSSGKGTLADFDARFQDVLPSDWYENGKKQKDLADAAELEKQLEANPIHIVIVPGIFSEMIPKTPYEEIFDAQSAACARSDVKFAARRRVCGKGA